MKSKNKNPFELSLKAHDASNFVAGSNPVFPTIEMLVLTLKGVVLQ